MSDVELCNEALARIGKTEINSLDEPLPAARHCKRFLPRTLREMQAAYAWEFNLAAVDLPTNTAISAVYPFRYAHRLPADYLRVAGVSAVPEVEPNSLASDIQNAPRGSDRYIPTSAYDRVAAGLLPPVTPMRIASGHVHAAFTPIRLTYHRAETDVTQLPEMFRAALVAMLAARLCFPLTKDIRLTETVKEEARMALMAAKDHEGLDEYDTTPEGSSLREDDYVHGQDYVRGGLR